MNAKLTVLIIIIILLTIGIILDHYGLFDLRIRRLNTKRLLGIILIIVGAALIIYF